MSGGAPTNIIGDLIASRASVDLHEPVAAEKSSTDHDDLKISKEVGMAVEVASVDDDEFPSPTEEEKRSLRRVALNMPLISFSLCIVEFAERASYYAAQNVYSNFIEFPLPRGGNGAGAPPRGTQETAGALGMGLQASNALVLLFQFLAYAIPIFGGWWADVHIGRWKAIVVGVLIAGVAHLIQLVGAIPSVLQRGSSQSFPPFIIGYLMLAFGAGIFKPNIAPTILDQNRHQKLYIKTLKSGEKVIVDPELTASRTMVVFYALVNVGAFYMLPTSYAEKYVGYWLTFLLAGIIYFILPGVLFAINNRTYKAPTSGNSELKIAFKIVWVALKQSKFRVWRKDFWDGASPTRLAERGITVEWSEQMVLDVRRTLAATEVFCYYPIWNINDGGVGSVATNQGASMTTNGAPNDVLNNFNALTIIVCAPLLTYVIYPFLKRRGIKFGRISRITFGFFLATVSGVIGAIVQWRVYKTSPCGYYASSCDIGTGVSPLSIWWQIPNQSLGALSEIFCMVTAYELAYARSPPSMRGLVTAVFLFMLALSSAIGEILTPATVDPYLIWLWAGPAIALGVQTVLFWFRFRWMNDDEYMTEAGRLQGNEPVVSDKQGEA